MAFETYWQFAYERQEIFWRRLHGMPAPWTDDEILRSYKFTNVYRVLDRVSQYLIREVIYGGDQDPREVFFRIVLFKLFNRIETWQLLQREMGPLMYGNFDVDLYDQVLTRALGSGTRIYSAAYIMPPSKGEAVKHRSHLRLLEHMLREELPERVREARSMREVFEMLKEFRLVGDFLGYQLSIDLNYSTLMDFDEMEFVVAGPGARAGIRKCFSDLGGLSESGIIRWVCERQEMEFESRDIRFRSLWGRQLQLVDAQNLFCEVDKYARVAHPELNGTNCRVLIKQRFAANPERVSICLPPKWGLGVHCDR